MIRTAAQVTAAGKASRRFHRETFEHGGSVFRFLGMGPLPETRRGQERPAEADTTRWLTDGRRFLLVRGSGKHTRTVERPVEFSANTRAGYPPNADTALTASDWTLGKHDPDPRTGERVYYGEALEVNGEWWRFWALAPVNTNGCRASDHPRWFTNGRLFGLVTGPQGKGTLVRVMT